MTRPSSVITSTGDGEELPWGSYQLYRYRLSKKGALVAEAGCDSDMSAAEVEREAKELRPNEGLRAYCRSQPGGMCAAGSERVRAAMAAEGVWK
jgi:hypothetical protein